MGSAREHPRNRKGQGVHVCLFKVSVCWWEVMRDYFCILSVFFFMFVFFFLHLLCCFCLRAFFYFYFFSSLLLLAILFVWEKGGGGEWALGGCLIPVYLTQRQRRTRELMGTGKQRRTWEQIVASCNYGNLLLEGNIVKFSL